MPPASLAGLDDPRVKYQWFRGSPDTLRTMREQALGLRGEKSLLVRELTEEIVADIWPKDYLSEILAIRNFGLTGLRYRNDPRHVEWIKDPERIVEEYRKYGVAQVDCDEIAELLATMALQIGRAAEFLVVGFGAPGEYSHVFMGATEPKSGTRIICDPVAGSDEGSMLRRVTTYEIWSLD